VPVYQVSHKTTYSYDDAVSVCHNLAHVRPRHCPRQSWRQSHLQVTPEPAVVAERRDYFGNTLTVFIIQELHRRLEVAVVGEVEVSPRESRADGAAWEQVRDVLRSGESRLGHLPVLQFLYPSPHIKPDRDIEAYARDSFEPGRPLTEAAKDLMGRIHRDFKYDPTATTVATPLAEVLRLRRGVCQDFAHLQVACLRAMGLAARYVSGYLLTQPPPGKEKLVGADATHAWASVYVPPMPEFGDADAEEDLDSAWLDLDPTNDIVPSERHITIAWGRDFGDVSPLRGVILGGGRHRIAVSVNVAEVEGDPMAEI
jgi:transglutaminase-like putative cysteine protease